MKELENLKYEISDTLYKMKHDYKFEEDDVIYMKGKISDWEILLNTLSNIEKIKANSRAFQEELQIAWVENEILRGKLENEKKN